MAMEVGAVYLSAYLDGDGLASGLADVRGAAETSLTPIAGLMERAFAVKPSFDLSGMSGELAAAVEAARAAIEPIVGKMGEAIVAQCAGAIGKLGTIPAFVSGAFLKQWGGAWNSVGDGFKAVWKGIGNFFSGVMNGVVGGINAVLNGLNKISITMPDWLGGGRFGFHLPLLSAVPYLAEGGIVRQPTLAMIGEAGDEAVLPLRRNTEWIADLADGIASALAARQTVGGGQSADTGGVVNLHLDGRKFAEAAVEHFAAAAARRDLKVWA